MNYKLATSGISLVVSAAIVPMLAAAQTSDDYFERDGVTPVSERTAPALDPVAIPLSGLEVRPEAVFSGGLVSNVLATEADEVDDIYVGFSPRFVLSSAWDKHAFDADAEVDHREFSDLKDESRTNLKIKLRGRLDLGRQTHLHLKLKAADQTEPRDALSSVPSALEPNEYSALGGAIGLEHQSGRIRLTTDLALSEYDYDDAELSGDLFQDQDFRDHSALTASARLAYALDRNVAVYTDVKHTEADYDPANFFSAFNRDSSGTVILLGTDFALGESISGEVGVGYQYYTYDDPAFDDISDFAFAGNVDVSLAPRTTLSLAAERKVIDPGTALSNAAIETGGRVILEQGLTRKLFLSGEAGLKQYAFETVDRDDDRVDLKLAANWKINPSIWLEGGYQVTDQSSDVQEFTDNRVLIRMRIFP